MTEPVWIDSTGTLSRSPLAEDTAADVCIVGAGLAGMLSAYALAKAGKRVVVVEGRTIGAGETGRTTAHLSNAFDDRYFAAEERHGADAARVIAASHTAGIDRLEQVARDEGIECEFRRLDGYLFLPPGESAELLDRELDAATRAGVAGVQRIAAAPSFATGPCLRFPNQAQFHPMKFMEGLTRAVERLGGRIFTGTPVTAVRNGSGLRVVTEARWEVTAAAVIVATNTPVNDRVTMHTKQAAYRTYAIAARVPAGAVAPALYWDTSDTAGDPDRPYHYVRVTPGEGSDLLIVGGEDHLTGQRANGDARWRALETWARERCPAMGEVVRRWSGQVLEPLDHGAAFIGANPSGPKGVYIVTGDSGQGMTHAAIASIMLPELIAGNEHPWSELYDPARKPTSAMWEYAQHNAKVAGRYTDWVRPASLIESIPAGEGRVVRRGGHMVAAYRDEGGCVHARSAVCPHMGCLVRWNNSEKSWDCPCHGSRFSHDGQVLNGPAPHGLAEAPTGRGRDDASVCHPGETNAHEEEAPGIHADPNRA